MTKKRITRFWVSWWSGNYADEGCTNPPFQFWNSGERDHRGNNPDRTDCALCAVIDCDTKQDAIDCIKKHFPDAEMRFCEYRQSNFVPGDRFPGFENRTHID